VVPDEILRPKDEGCFCRRSFLRVISGSIRASDARHEFLPDGFVNARPHAGIWQCLYTASCKSLIPYDRISAFALHHFASISLAILHLSPTNTTRSAGLDTPSISLVAIV